MSMFSNPLAFIKSQLMPVGTIIEWSPVEGGGVDLSTPAKVAAYYGFGTWELYGAGRMLLGTDSSHAVGSTGGAEQVTLTETCRSYRVLFILVRATFLADLAALASSGLEQLVFSIPMDLVLWRIGRL